MALPIQLFLAGPIARALFRLIFRRTKNTEEENPNDKLAKKIN